MDTRLPTSSPDPTGLEVLEVLEVQRAPSAVLSRGSDPPTGVTMGTLWRIGGTCSLADVVTDELAASHTHKHTHTLSRAQALCLILREKPACVCVFPHEDFVPQFLFFKLKSTL